MKDSLGRRNEAEGEAGANSVTVSADRSYCLYKRHLKNQRNFTIAKGNQIEMTHSTPFYL